MKKWLVMVISLIIVTSSYAKRKESAEIVLGADPDTVTSASYDKEEEDSTIKTSTKNNKKKANKENNSQFECGTKRYCKEMKSCAEAKFFLNQCGLERLDRDGDGKPCENVCR